MAAIVQNAELIECGFELQVESVDLALKILDGYNLRDKEIQVERAKFEQKGEYDPKKKPKKKKSKDKKKIQQLQSKWVLLYMNTKNGACNIHSFIHACMIEFFLKVVGLATGQVKGRTTKTRENRHYQEYV